MLKNKIDKVLSVIGGGSKPRNRSSEFSHADSDDRSFTDDSTDDRFTADHAGVQAHGFGLGP